MIAHETTPELSLLQALGDLSRADYEFKFAPAVRQTILDLSQKEETEEILKLSPSYDGEARQVTFDHGDSLAVRRRQTHPTWEITSQRTWPCC